MIHVSKAMLHFEDIRIIRDMRNTANRLVNCENAINKVVNAATRQIEEIQYIEDTVGLDALPDKLSDIAKIRLENPEISLKEFKVTRCYLLGLSRNQGLTTDCVRFLNFQNKRRRKAN